MCLFGKRYPQWQKHAVTKQKDKGKTAKALLFPVHFVCSVCQQSWLSAEAISDRCPGKPVYQDFGREKPDYLVTAKELEVLGFKKPKEAPHAYQKTDYYPYGTGYIPLYDRRTAEKRS
jgi:hypothetical protein